MAHPPLRPYKPKKFNSGLKPASQKSTKRELPLLPFEIDSSSQPISKESSLVFPNEDDKFTLTELVDGYAALFPLRVCVTKGYCEDHGESSAIAVDELYNLHFVKRAKVVSISDIIGNKYVIPINSAAKFGLIQEQGIRIFSTVEDIMNASVLPQIVAARAGYVGDNNNSVLRNEILVIQGVVKAGGKFKIGRSAMLKVFSITNNVEKILSKEVFGKFTTDPFCTQIYLREFLEYIKDPTPNKVRLFLDFESEQPLPDHLIAEEVSLNYIYMETSVIASSFSEDELNSPLTSIRECDSSTVNIPITLDIEVSVILPPDDNDYEKLTEETRLLLINFDPTTAVRHIESTTEEGGCNDDDVYSYAAQNQFFRCVRQGFESEGLKIEIPNKLKELALPLVSHDSHQMGKVRKECKVVEDVDHDYIEADEFERPPKLPPLPPKVVKKSKAELPPEQPTLHSPHHQVTPGCGGPPVSKRDSSIRKMSDTDTLSNYVNTQKFSVAVNDPQHPISTHQRLTEKPIVSKPQHMNMSVPLPLPPSTKTRAVEDEEGDSNCKKIEFPSVVMRNPIELKERLNDVIARVEVLEKIQQQPHSSKMLDGLLEHTRELESVKESRDKIKKLEKQVKDLEMKVMEMMKTLSDTRLGDQQKGQGVREVRGDNTSLTHLDTAQILQLLHLMNMSKYLKVFQEARIDGAILAECDDDVLESELCVSSKLDRMKLLLVISGKKTVADIFSMSCHM